MLMSGREGPQPRAANDTYWYVDEQVTGEESTEGKHGRYSGDGFLVKLNNNR